MGVIRFHVYPPGRISAQDAERAYLAGMERTPWRGRVSLTSESLAVERSESDSGNLYIPWSVAGHGTLMLSTGTLRERPKPYQLAVELARGTINQVRCQLAEWQALGLAVTDHVTRPLRQAVEQFSAAATTQDDAALSVERAGAALSSALDASQALAASFTEQALVALRQASSGSGPLLGMRLGSGLPDGKMAAHVKAAFNSVAVPVVWREVEATEGEFHWDRPDQQIEWCRSQGLKVCAGPLVQLDNFAIPDWLCLWQGDFDNLLTFVSRYVAEAVTRYRGRVDAWHCAARINLGPTLSLGEEERLRLAVRIIEVVRQIDPGPPVVLFFDQPWAEYMSRREVVLSPFDFADAIVRAGLGLTGLGLECNLGYEPGGTFPRDLLAVSRLVDQWSQLTVPLHFALTVPSGEADDPLAHGASRPLADIVPGGWTADSQRKLAERVVALLLARPTVQSVIWNAHSDAEPHELPHSGLVDAEGRPKPVLEALTRLRKEHVT